MDANRPPKPVCCAKPAYRMMQQAIGELNQPDGLIRGAVALSMHQMRDASHDEVVQTLESHAAEIAGRVRGRQTQAKLAHLHELLFDTLGYGGDNDDYFNPLNSYLPAAITLRRGLPITLSLVYKCVAERVGLRVRGVGLPGHFIVAVRERGNWLHVDPFHGGRVLSEDDARELIHELFAGDVSFSRSMLAPVTPRHWLGRMLQNLLHVFTQSEQYTNVAAVLELEQLLFPNEPMLQRDLALVLARVGQKREAGVYLRQYLQTHPDDPIVDELRQLLGAIG